MRNDEYLDLYLENNWKLFPTNTKKAPLVPGGFKAATSDINQLQHWYKSHPNANVAIATGHRSGIWVLDIDCKNGVDGIDSLYSHLNKDEPKLMSLFENPYVITPSGGIHIYFAWEPELQLRNSAALLPGIDIRGEGGYVLAPPSVCYVNGERTPYRWQNSPTALGPAPSWLLSDIADLKQRRKSPSPTKEESRTEPRFDVSTVLHGLPQGRRDDGIYKYAAHLKGVGIPYDIAVGFIREAAARCTPPFDQKVAEEKVIRIYKNSI
ncbi:MAG: bifunctional DNA primase/polymerase [Arenibacter sp.]|jgi:putative DNA primase/helicase|uniref:bifunctional DNA primase/polymerase n=1 Tax=Alloalcanivorax xenomutans TaxID=1094342 RepID=UPI000E271352